MKKLLLFFAMCASLGAWAQTCVVETTSDVDMPMADRTVEATLSGDWLNGANADAEITKLINFVMGYNAETGTFDESQAYGKVIIKSAEGNTVTVKQSLIQQLVTGKAGYGVDFPNGYALEKNKITYLDLRDIAVTGYVGHDNSSSHDPDATLFCRNGGFSPVKYFAMPSFDTTVADQAYSIPPYTIAQMNVLDEIILPKNTVTVEHCSFAGVNVPSVKLNVGLEFIGNSAFYADSQIDKETTLDVPSTVKYIGPGAFNFRNFSDIYFHSAQAPICPVGKTLVDGEEAPFLLFGNYTGWGGITGVAGGGDAYDTSGVANRLNYRNQDGYWFTMLHFPASADVPNLDISSYKDETRVYNKIYGSVYYDVNNDKGNLELGVPGKEQEYIAREKVWAFQGAYDFVGKEETVLEYDGQTTELAPSGDAIPAEAVGKGVVDSGFEDTYRGLNYIWPSQTQYNRAYATVANGYNWDGFTKYRPKLTPEQYELMVKDNLTFTLNGQDVVVGQDITYDEAMANAYNATLPGAIQEGGVKETYDAEGAIAYNSTLDNAVAEGDTYSYTDTQAAAYNANLNGAVKEGDVETTWTAADANTNNATLQGAWREGEEIHPTAEEVLAHNADFEGAKHENDVEPGHDATWLSYSEYIKTTEWINRPNQEGWWANQHDETAYNSMVSQCIADNNAWTYNNWPLNPITSAKVDGFTYTAEQAAAYNAANNPNPWTTSTVLGTRTVEEANAHNATLDGAKHEGDPKTYYSAEAAKQHNQTLDGAVSPGAYVEFTAETAAAFNATLDGAVKVGDTKSTYTAEEANTHNAELLGARAEGFATKNYADPAIEDYLRMIAFQSTRRIVFADNAGGGDNYKVNIPSSKAWWTICLPFDLTKAQIDKFFGEGTHVCKFDKVERKIVKEAEAAKGERSFVKFYFTDDQYVGKNANDVVLEAHEAYMIFPTVDEEDAVYLANGIPMSEYRTKPGSPIPTVITSTPEGDNSEEYRFIGNYDTKLPTIEIDPETGKNKTIDVVVPQYSYIYAKKSGATGKHPYQFWFTQNAGIKWAANKCIIQSTSADRGLNDNSTFFKEKEKVDSNDTDEVKQITVFAYDEEDFAAEETAIEEVIYVFGSGEDQEVIYSVNGVKLDAAPSKGIYIKNGKKYFAR